MKGDGVEAEWTISVAGRDGWVEDAVVVDAVGGGKGHIVDGVKEGGVA